MTPPANAQDVLVITLPRRTKPTVVAELKTQVRRRKAMGSRELVWSVNVGGLSDETLDETLAAMARIGCVGAWERECGFVAHYTLSW